MRFSYHFFLSVYPVGHLGFVAFTVFVSFPLTHVIVFLITPAPMVNPRDGAEVAEVVEVGVGVGAGQALTAWSALSSMEYLACCAGPAPAAWSVPRCTNTGYLDS